MGAGDLFVYSSAEFADGMTRSELSSGTREFCAMTTQYGIASEKWIISVLIDKQATGIKAEKGAK